MKTVCVIGSSHGAILAVDKLLETGKFKIKVIDVNSFGTSNTKLHLESLNVGSDFNLSPTRYFGFGGTSNLWHGVVTDFDREDWNQINKHCDYDLATDVHKYFVNVDNKFGVDSSLFRSDSSKNLGANLGQKKKYVIQTSPFRTLSVLESFKSNTNIDLVENSIALYFKSQKLSDSDEVIQSLVLFDRVSNKQKEVTADFYILSAGALESPRLLLQSKHNGFLKFSSNAIGENLMDHPWAIIGEIGPKRALDKILGIGFDKSLNRRLKFRTALRVQEPQLTNLLNHTISVKPNYGVDYNDFMSIIKDLITKSGNSYSLIELLTRYKFIDILKVGLVLLSEKFNINLKYDRGYVYAYLEQIPIKESLVSLSNTYDEYGRNIPKINWNLHDSGCYESMKFINDYCIRYFTSIGVDYISVADGAKLISGSHHAGTLRIGKNSDNGCIDTNLKLFGVTNLFVCDGSIFPYFGNANPSYLINVFSLRLGCFIADNY